MAPIAFAVRRRSSGARPHRYPARYPASKASPAPMGSTSTAGKAGCSRISPSSRTRLPLSPLLSTTSCGPRPAASSRTNLSSSPPPRPRAAPLGSPLLRSPPRGQLSHEPLVVPPPERPGLLVADEQQIHQGQYLLRKPLGLRRGPELGAVVHVEAHPRPARASLSGGPENEGAAIGGEGGGDAREVEERCSRQVVRIESFGGHLRGGRAPPGGA